MKRWTASAAALILVLALAVPAIGAEERDSKASAWSIDLQHVVSWLATIWFDFIPPEEPPSSDGEQPQAFIEGLGPYIVPIGQATPNPDTGAIEQTAGQDGSDSEDP